MLVPRFWMKKPSTCSFIARDIHERPLLLLLKVHFHRWTKFFDSSSSICRLLAYRLRKHVRETHRVASRRKRSIKFYERYTPTVNCYNVREQFAGEYAPLEGGHRGPCSASGNYSRVFRFSRSLSALARDLIAVFYRSLHNDALHRYIGPSCNCNWKRENCVLFSPPKRRIVLLLNLGKQSVRFDTGINYSPLSVYA